MSDQESRFGAFIIIFLLATGLVALGMRDVEKRFVNRKDRTPEENEALVRDLMGGRDVQQRAMISNKAFKDRSEQRDHVSKQDKQGLNRLIDTISLE